MEGKGSTLVHVVVIALSLTAFGFAIAAERRRSTVSFHLVSETPLPICEIGGGFFFFGFRVLKLVSHFEGKLLFVLHTFLVFFLVLDASQLL
jgi:hypothetical protein